MKKYLPILFSGFLFWGCSDPGELSKPTNAAVRESAQWVELIADSGMQKWQADTGEWFVAGNAVLNAENENLLSFQPGTGVLINGPSGKTVDLHSIEEFGDVEAHIEFMVPRGSNSGVYFQGRYEIQVFDSWGVEEPKHSDCGGIYQRWIEAEQKGFEGHPPLLNASLPPGQWQSFEVVFRAPRFDENGIKVANARFEKVVLNGTIVHENVEVTGPTRAATFENEKNVGPLMVQGDHGPVAYRNIRVKMLD